MKKIIIALLTAHFLTVAYTLLWVIDDRLPLIKKNLFLDRSAMPAGIEIGWYIKYITDHLTWCVTYFCFSYIASFCNKKVFLVVTLLGIYHLVDFICFMVDFHQSWWTYWALMGAILACVIIIMMPIKEKAKIISLE